MAKENVLTVRFNPEQMALIEALQRQISVLNERVEMLEKREQMRSSGLPESALGISRG